MIKNEILFKIPVLIIDIDNWKIKKNKLIKLLKNYPEEKIGLLNFYTNKSIIDVDCITKFSEIFKKEFEELTQFLKTSINIKNVWSVSYKQNNFQTVHNHGALGFTGIIYLDLPKNYPPTYFVQPWNNFITNNTDYVKIDDVNEKIILVPSFVNHFSNPNLTKKDKRIVSFDLDIL
jgi:hypothetical protein